MDNAAQEQDTKEIQRGLASLWRKETMLKHFVWSFPLFATLGALFIALKTDIGDPTAVVVIMYLLGLVGLAVWVVMTPCPRCDSPALSSRVQTFQKDGCCHNCGLDLRRPRNRKRDIMTFGIITGCYLLLFVAVLVLSCNAGA